MGPPRSPSLTESLTRLAQALADRYRIERELGQGGMATVYLAHDLKHDRLVAVKVLKPELAAVLGAERFVVEIKTTAALQHPHILPLFDSGSAGGFLFYVMPYIEGETLRAKLDRETQLGIEEAVRITTEVADALDYAHRHGVIHRDIKPENILLHDGRPMVADFGIALALSAAAGGRMTETGLSLGTPHYMSPEQATAERDLTPRSDVYSLGSVLYEMLTGNPPHTGATAQQIIMKIVTEEAAPVTVVRKSVPPNVAAAVAQAVERLPADRFASARAFADALRDPAFRTSSVVTGAGGAGGATARAPLVVASVATAVVATALAIWGWMRPEPIPPLLRYAMSMTGEAAVSNAAPVLGNRIAISPDGRRLAYVGGDGNPGGPALYLRERSSLHATRLPRTNSARSPLFSPAGDRIAFFEADGSLNVIGVSGEPARRLGDGSFNDSRGGAWGRDGFLYASPRGDVAAIARIPEDGGPWEPVTRVDTANGERLHQLPAMLAGGRALLFTIRAAGGEADRIAVVDLRTGIHRVLLSGLRAIHARSGHLLYVTSSGTMMAVPFDESRLEVTGRPVPVADSIGVSRLGAEMALSDAGTLVYFTGTAGYGVQPVWVDRSGKAEAIDPAWTFLSTALYSSMAISPDGSRLLVSEGGGGGQQLYVKSLPRGPKQQLTFEGTVNSRASWSGNRTVVYLSDRDGGNKAWRRVADGSGPAELLLKGIVNEALMSPDGAWIVYRGAGGDRHVYARRASGDTSVLVVARSERAEELSPALSPDGRWIAYVSTESGTGDVYVKPFPDVDRRKLLVSIAGGIEPRWSRDGRELFYRNSANELVATDVRAQGDSLILGERRVLFSMAGLLPANMFQATFDVHPDGSRFVMGRRLDAGGGEQVVVVENFIQHLRGVRKE